MSPLLLSPASLPPPADALGFPTLDLGVQGRGRCVFSFSRFCKLVFPSEVPPLRMVERCQQQWKRLCFDFARLRVGRSWFSMPLNGGEALLSVTLGVLYKSLLCCMDAVN